MKKIKGIKKFLTNREYWDYTNQNIPCTKMINYIQIKI